MEWGRVRGRSEPGEERGKLRRSESRRLQPGRREEHQTPAGIRAMIS